MDANKETTAEQPKTKLGRILTVVCDALPSFGKIREHKFTTSLGAGVTFTKAEPVFHQGRKHSTFSITVNQQSPLWSSIELRDLAQECVTMAEYLEKQTD